MQAIVLHKTGDSDVLKIEKNYPDPKCEADEVVVKHNAIGVNFFDISFRRGQYKTSKSPLILGFEASGVVAEIGSNVNEYKVGDRVAYATGPYGAYCEKRAIHKHHLIPLPNEISDAQAAAVLAKGLMTHALLHRVYIAKRAKRILVHAAAGGVGHLLCQWAKSMGIEVIGTVGHEAKVNFAQSFGCAHVINYKEKDFVEELSQITNHEGVGLVYDGVGKDTLEKSLHCLWPMGICVSYGEASGSTEKVDLDLLAINSLYLTRPTLALYKSNRVELTLSAREVFAAVTQGILKPKITTFNFSDVQKAHQAMENREIIGSCILTL